MDFYTAYNENGDLAKFEIDEGKVKCGHCGKIYYQERYEQVPGFREVDDDKGVTWRNDQKGRGLPGQAGKESRGSAVARVPGFEEIRGW